MVLLADLAQDARGDPGGDDAGQRHNGGSFSSGGLAREHDSPMSTAPSPDCWCYLVEVQDAGRPPDATGYR